MTTMALTAHVMTTAAVVTDERPVRAYRRSRGRSSTRSLRSINDAIRAYYAAKLAMILGSVTVAMMAGAFIGAL